jgi:hypothetical protein
MGYPILARRNLLPALPVTENRPVNDPAPPYKGTLMLRVKETAIGWTENVWVNRPSFDSAMAALEEVAERRAELLPTSHRIMRLKVSNPLLRRAVLEKYHYNLDGRYECNPHTVWTVLGLRLQGNRAFARYNLGGVPRGLMTHGVPTLVENWQKAFDRFAETLKTNCVLLSAAKGEVHPVASVATSADHRGLVITMQSMPAEFVTGAVIRVDGVAGAAPVNHDWRIEFVNGNVLYTRRGLRRIYGTPAGMAFVNLVEKNRVSPIIDVQITRLSPRKRGMGHSYPPRGWRKRRV